jgi:hypothetical protein
MYHNLSRKFEGLTCPGLYAPISPHNLSGVWTNGFGSPTLEKIAYKNLPGFPYTVGRNVIQPTGLLCAYPPYLPV